MALTNLNVYDLKMSFANDILQFIPKKHPKKEVFISKVETMKIDFFGKAKSPKID